MGPLVQNDGEGDQMDIVALALLDRWAVRQTHNEAQRMTIIKASFGGPQASEHELLEAKGAFVGEVPPRGFHLVP